MSHTEGLRSIDEETSNLPDVDKAILNKGILTKSKEPAIYRYNIARAMLQPGEIEKLQRLLGTPKEPMPEAE